MKIIFSFRIQSRTQLKSIGNTTKMRSFVLFVGCFAGIIFKDLYIKYQLKQLLFVSLLTAVFVGAFAKVSTVSFNNCLDEANLLNGIHGDFSYNIDLSIDAFYIKLLLRNWNVYISFREDAMTNVTSLKIYAQCLIERQVVDRKVYDSHDKNTKIPHEICMGSLADYEKQIHVKGGKAVFKLYINE